LKNPFLVSIKMHIRRYKLSNRGNDNNWKGNCWAAHEQSIYLESGGGRG
jgi:hypothetical protein